MRFDSRRVARFTFGRCVVPPREAACLRLPLARPISTILSQDRSGLTVQIGGRVDRGELRVMK